MSDKPDPKGVDVPKCWNWTDADLERHDEEVAAMAASRAILENGEPFLGLATTMQLIEELRLRAVVSTTVGETWPDYRTVDGGFSVNVEITNDEGSQDVNPSDVDPDANKVVVLPGELEPMRFVGNKDTPKE